MDEDSAPKPAGGPRKPVFVPSGERKAAPGRNVRPAAAPRVISPAPGAARPAPGSLVRALIATRGWANIDAFAFIIFGCLTVAQTAKRWIRTGEIWSKLNVDPATMSAILVRAEMIVSFAFAAGCLFAAVKLFRYSGTISRLRQASRMQELENALRHQRTVWIVLGSVGALWLVMFASQLVYLIIGVNEIEDARADMEEVMP